MLPSEKVFHLRARPIISDHFPIMCLGACERGMRNNVSGPRLTTGLKRDERYAIRRGPASPFLEENERNERVVSSSFRNNVAAPNSLDLVSSLRAEIPLVQN